MIDYLENEVEKRSDEMKHIEVILQEKEEEIHQLKQQISSQEECLAQRGVNLPDKTSLLSGIANLVEQLYKAQEEHQQCSLDLTLRSRKALYHQQHAEELTYTMVCGFITVQLPSHMLFNCTTVEPL